MKAKKLLGSILTLAVVIALLAVSVFAAAPAESAFVLPDGITADDFGDNTVTDGENFYATMVEALKGIHLKEVKTLWCKPGADVGTMTHGHVCSSLTIYGNSAYVSGGEQEFEIDTYKNGENVGTACDGLTEELTLTVIALNGSGAWGQRNSTQTINLVFENCENMSRIYITGTTGVNNVTLTDCTFTSNTGGNCKVYTNANGTVTLNDCEFSNVDVPVNLNHKVAGTQSVIINNCSFTNCGTAEYDYSAPVRVLSSVDGAHSALTVKGCSFSGTVANKQAQNADILLDYGIGSTCLSVTDTAAVLIAETEENVGTSVTIDKADGYTNAVAKVGGTYYTSLQAAINAAQSGDTVTLLSDIELTATLVIAADDVITLDLNGYTLSGLSETATSSAVITNNGTLTIQTSVEGGKITSQALNPDVNWGGEGEPEYPTYANNTINNSGTLILESGTIENATPSSKGACYAIDNYYGGTITLNGGLVDNKGNIAIRQFIGSAHTNTVTVNEGAEVAGTRAIWVQLSNNTTTVAPDANVIVNGGKLTSYGYTDSYGYDWKMAIYVYTYGNSRENVDIEIREGSVISGDVMLGGGTANSYENVTITGGSFVNEMYGFYTYAGDGALEYISITGGTFSIDPSDYVAEGYKATKTEDGYMVVPHYVAQIEGGEQFTSLQAAVDAAVDGDTIVLIDDVTLTAQNIQELMKPVYNRESYAGLIIPDDKVVTIDLNGKTVSYVDTYYDIDNVMVLNLGNLTINDSVGGGKLTYKPVAGSKTYTYFYSTIFNCGTLTVNGGTIENTCETATDVSNAIDNHSRLSHEYDNDCILTVNGGTIIGAEYRAIRQYTHYFEGVKNRVTINDGTIMGGIYMQHGDSWYYADPAKNRLNVDCYLTINGGTITTIKIADGTDYGHLRLYLSNPDNAVFGWEINGGTIEVPVQLYVQRGVYYTNGVSGATTPAETAGTRNAEWLAANGGFISGGTFSTELDATYLAKGYYAAENGDGTYTVKALITGTGTETDPYLISDLEALKYFRDSVNAGETTYNAAGVYVALGDDIDMAGTDWSVNIGDDCNYTFDGIFDGKGHTIYNLTATETAAKSDGYVCTGLFGAIYGSAEIKNLTIENVSINTGDFTGNNAAAVVGFAYKCTGVIENVTVTGNIQINAENITGTGVIVGYDYYGTLTVKNCRVSGDSNSYITGKSYVGGIIGYASTNSTITGCTVENITVNATGGAVGGIAGIQLAGGGVSKCTVKNVALTVEHENWQNSAGIAVGTITSTTTVSGTEFENVTVNGITTDVMVGSEHKDKPTTPVAAVAARVGDTYYTTLQAAIDDAESGDTIVLLSDITLTKTVHIYAGDKVTLDLNGKTVDYDPTVWVYGAANSGTALLTVDFGGDLTITDSSAEQTGTLDASYNEGFTSSTYDVYGAVMMTAAGDDASNGTAKLTVEKGTLIGYFAAVAGNKNRDNTEIVINGGKLTVGISNSYSTVGIEHPMNGKLTINGGIIEGMDGISLRSGTLLITGGTIIGNAPESAFEDDGYWDNNFGTCTGHALQIVNRANSEPTNETPTVSITGGTFISKNTSAVGSYAGYKGETPDTQIIGFITGGTFSTEPDATYLAEGYIVEETEDGYMVVPHYVAQIEGGEQFISLQAAVDAAVDGDTIVLLGDIELASTVQVAKGQEIILDLAGKTITGTDSVVSGNFELICNKGTLTIKGKGVITLTAEHDRGWDYYSAVVSNQGGTLTIEGSTLKHLGGSDMAYTIDNNSTLGETTLTVKDGELVSTYRAIRAFQNSSTKMNSIVVEGGLISARAGIWMHQAGADSLGELTIKGGTFECYSNAVVVDIHSGGKTTINIEGGKFSNTNENANLLLVWPFSDMSTVTESNRTVLNITGGTFDCAGEGKLIGLLYGADANSEVTVSGGNFSESVVDYLAKGYIYEAYKAYASCPYSYHDTQPDLCYPVCSVGSYYTNLNTNEVYYHVQFSFSVPEGGTILEGDYDHEDSSVAVHTSMKSGSEFNLNWTGKLEGYTFLGWINSNTNETQTSYIVTGKESDVIRFTADMRMNPTITFDLNDDGESGDKLEPATVEYGKTLEYLPVSGEDFYRYHYVFKGWFTEDGTEVTLETTFTEDTTLYAHWEKRTTFDLFFRANVYIGTGEGGEDVYDEPIGATYTMTAPDGTVISSVPGTGDYEGYLIFKDLTIAYEYTLTVTCPGYKTYTITTFSDLGGINLAELGSGTGTVIGGTVLEKELDAPELTVTLNADNVPQLKWTAVDGAEKYEVYRAVGDGEYVRFYTTRNTSLTNTSVVAGETYSYMVRAVGGEFSEAVSVTVPYAAPELTVTLNADNVPYLKWTAVDGAEKYEVYRAVGDGEYVRFYTTRSTSLTNTSVEPGVTYSYMVCAVGGVFSEVVSVTTPYAAPVLTVTLNADNVPYLKWTAVNGASRYEVYRAASADGEYTRLISTVYTHLTNTSAEAGMTYYYKVCAVGGEFSEAVSVTVPYAAPELTVTLNADNVPYLKWTAVNGAEKYEVYRAVGDGEYVRFYTTRNTSLTNTSVEPGVTYSYMVRAVDGEFSEAVTITIPAEIIVPELTVTLNGSDKPYLKWTAVDGAAKYEVYRSTSADGEYTRLITTSYTAITHASAEAGVTYYYKVRAVGGEFSDVVSITVPVKVVSPTLTVTLNSSGKPYLKWTAVDSATGYQVYRAIGDGEFALLYTGKGTVLTNTSVTAGVTYSYKVCAVGGEFSNVVTITVPCAAPTVTVTLNSKGDPRLSWNAVEGAVRYQVMYSANGGSYTHLIYTTYTNLTHSSSVPGTEYTYVVRAICADASGNSDLSAPVTITAE